MDPIPIAIYGGVIPGGALALLMLAAAWASRPPAPDAAGATPARATPLARLAIPTLAWLAGFLIAVACIHLTSFTSWRRPALWPASADQRLLHSAAILALWGLIDISLGAAIRPPRGPQARSHPPAWLAAVRWTGRALALAGVLAVLAHAYVGEVGWGMLIALVAAGTALALISTYAMAAAARGRHPALPWATQFLGALAAAGVLFMGRTSTGSQAAAGLGALAAATAAALLIAPRAAPGPVSAFLWTSCLAWVLMLGCVGTGQTNLASCALVLAAPWGWLLPRSLDPLLPWKRVPLTLAAAIAWAVVCAGAAVGLAALTQSPSESYEF